MAFIDFRKAYDSVVRTKMSNILRKRGVKGKMYPAIVCMYKVVKAKVRSGSDLTDSFIPQREARRYMQPNFVFYVH